MAVHMHMQYAGEYVIASALPARLADTITVSQYLQPMPPLRPTSMYCPSVLQADAASLSRLSHFIATVYESGQKQQAAAAAQGRKPPPPLAPLPAQWFQVRGSVYR